MLSEEQVALETASADEELAGWVRQLALLQSEKCCMQDKIPEVKYLVPLFAAREPAKPAATTASARVNASAMLKKKVSGRRPQKRLCWEGCCGAYFVSYTGSCCVPLKYLSVSPIFWYEKGKSLRPSTSRPPSISECAAGRDR